MKTKLLSIIIIMVFVFSSIQTTNVSAASAPLVINSLKYTSTINDGQNSWGTFSFDVTNNTTKQISVKIDSIVSTTVRPQFPSWASVLYDPSGVPSFWVTINARSTKHITGKYRLPFSWNEPSLIACKKNLNYSYIVSTFTNYVKGALIDAATKNWYSILDSGVNAFGILDQSNLVQKSAILLITPRVTYNNTSYLGMKFAVSVNVPVSKINTFRAGIASQISGVVLGAVQVPSKFDILKAYAGANLYIWGCTAAVSTILP